MPKILSQSRQNIKFIVMELIGAILIAVGTAVAAISDAIDKNKK